MIRTLLLLLAFTFFLPALGQQEQDSLSLSQDMYGSVDKREFDEKLSEKYSGDEFNYEFKDGESQNLLERFLNWFFKTLRNTFGIDLPPGFATLLKYLIYTLMSALALYLLVKFLVGENIGNVFTKKAPSIIDINLSESHIEQVDLSALIKEALAQKDYRTAIRYQYLRALKTLSQQNIIDWHFEKTNLDYQKEISTPGIKNIFQEVSYIYDYIWYGEQYIDATIYKAAQERFTALKNSIKI